MTNLIYDRRFGLTYYKFEIPDPMYIISAHPRWNVLSGARINNIKIEKDGRISYNFDGRCRSFFYPEEMLYEMKYVSEERFLRMKVFL